MRLRQNEVDAILATAREVFGADVIVRLFGSRVDDGARGGDIDLLIETTADRLGIRHESRFLSHLFKLIDERKIDLVLVERGVPLPAFAAMVLPTSVEIA